jgi:antitoxin CptB
MGARKGARISAVRGADSFTLCFYIPHERRSIRQSSAAGGWSEAGLCALAIGYGEQHSQMLLKRSLFLMTDFPTDPQHLEVRRRRLIYRAEHRGTYENDLLLGGFVRAEISALNAAELDDLEAVLELPDPELADWLTGRQPIPAHADCPMLRRIRAAVLAR